MKMVTVGDFLTNADIRQAEAIWRATKGKGGFVKRVVAELLTPEKMVLVNKALGQENDPAYLAYAIEYAFTQRDRAAAHA